jgi:hypothetical protein
LIHRKTLQKKKKSLAKKNQRPAHFAHYSSTTTTPMAAPIMYPITLKLTAIAGVPSASEHPEWNSVTDGDEFT